MNVEVLGWDKVLCATCSQPVAHKVEGMLRIRAGRTWFTMYTGTAEIPCRSGHMTMVRLTEAAVPV